MTIWILRLFLLRSSLRGKLPCAFSFECDIWREAIAEIFSILMVRAMDENCGIRGIDNHSQAFPATASISDHFKPAGVCQGDTHHYPGRIDGYPVTS